MTGFKVGDKVKIVENSSYSANAVGEIGVITTIGYSACFVEVAMGRKKCWHIFSDLELVTEPKFYDEVVTRKVVLNRDYITTDLPSGDKFVTSGGSVCVNIVNTRALMNSDIPTIISHLQQWYAAVQLEKGNGK